MCRVRDSDTYTCTFVDTNIACVMFATLICVFVFDPDQRAVLSFNRQFFVRVTVWACVRYHV